VDGVQRPRERLAGLHQVAQIGPRVTAANHALAGGIGRTLIFRIIFAFDVQPSLAGEQEAVARGAGGQHAVHHIHAHAGILLDLVGVADAHHVAGFAGGQQRQHFGDDLQSQIAGLAHAEASDGVAVEVHLHQALRALTAQIGVHAALHDAEEALRAPSKFVAPHYLVAVGAEVIERPPRPGHGEPQALLGPAAIRRVLGALVEGHRNIRAQGDLHLHGVLGSEKMAAAVQVRAEADALVGDLTQPAQAEDLKAAGVGEQGPRPTHEPVQPAHAADGFVAGPQVEMIGVGEDDLRAQRFQHVLRNGLDRARGAHRHEDRRFYRPVGQTKLTAPPARFGFRDDFEGRTHPTILAGRGPMEVRGLPPLPKMTKRRFFDSGRRGDLRSE